MPDFEKVIKGIEHCRLGSAGCTMDCPYDMPENCTNILMTDALVLLKEQDRLLCKQQKDIDKLQADYAMLRHKFLEKTQIVRCKDCKYWVGNWLEGGNMINTKCTLSHRYPQPSDWFCADGERKDNGNK